MFITKATINRFGLSLSMKRLTPDLDLEMFDRHHQMLSIPFAVWLIPANCMISQTTTHSYCIYVPKEEIEKSIDFLMKRFKRANPIKGTHCCGFHCFRPTGDGRIEAKIISSEISALPSQHFTAFLPKYQKN